jgi:AcrR family transcriptional regulator
MENSRQAILDVAIRDIIANKSIRVTDIAEDAGVTAGLIYRYFSSREELITAAYREVVRGFIDADLAATKELHGLPYQDFFDGLCAIWQEILSPKRRTVRLARINALGYLGKNTEPNESLSSRKLSGYQEYVDGLSELFGFTDPERKSQLSSMVLIALSLPLGFTALNGDSLPQSERDSVAFMLTGFTMDFLSRSGYQWLDS